MVHFAAIWLGPGLELKQSGLAVGLIGSKESNTPAGFCADQVCGLV